MGIGEDPLRSEWRSEEAGDSRHPRTSLSEPLRNAVHVSLLGQFRLAIDGVPVPVPAGAQRLIARLAVGGRQHRLHLATTLWPDIDEERGLGRLRSVLWRLHRSCPELVAVSDGHLALGQEVVVDVHRLLGAVRRTLEPNEGVDAPTAVQHLRSIDADDLLPGWYDEWVLPERDRLVQLKVRALEALSDSFIAVGRPADALEAAAAAVRADPLRESGHRAIIRAHLASGNPAAGFRQYQTYVQLLRTELGIDRPTVEMRVLVDGILTTT